MACEKLVSSVRQWRLQQSFVEQLSVLHHVMTGEQIYNKFVPIMFRYIGGNVSASRLWNVMQEYTYSFIFARTVLK